MRADHGIGGRRAGRVAGDRGDELVSVERQQLGAVRHVDAGGAGHVADERDLAEVAALAQPGDDSVLGHHVDLAALDQIEAVSRVAGREHRLAGRCRDGGQLSGEPLQRRLGQRRHERHLTQQREPGGIGGAAVDPDQHRPGDGRQHRQQRAHHQQRRAGTGQVDQQRRQHRTKADRGGEYALQHAEHAAQHLVRHHPLEQRQPGHIDERVADADHHQHRHRHGRVHPQADQRDRQPPGDQPDREVRCQLAAAHQGEGDQAADHPAHADRSVQRADAAVSEREQVDRHHDDHHRERAGHDRLGSEQPDDQAQPRVGADHPEARQCLPGKALGPFGARLLPRPGVVVGRVDRGHQQQRPDERGRVERKHGARTGCGQHQATNGRAGEGTDAVDRACHHVGGRHLPGVRVRDGISAVCAGGKAVAMIEVRTASR